MRLESRDGHYPTLGLVLVLVLSDFAVDSAFSQSGAATLASPTSPTGILSSVPITITNSQPYSTTAPFQEMIAVNSFAYSSLEASNLQNVEFFQADGAVIPSWLESGNSNLSTTTVYWLSIPEGIPAQSSVTIFMGFASVTTNLFDGIKVGEAPNLSQTYGQFDNGKYVFQFYDNFNGTEIGPGWTTENTPGHYIVDNGLTILPNSTVFDLDGNVAGAVVYALTNAKYGLGTAVDFYVNSLGNKAFLGYLESVGPQNNDINPGAYLSDACGNTYPDQGNFTALANECGAPYCGTCGNAGLFFPTSSPPSGVYSVTALYSGFSLQTYDYDTLGSQEPLTAAVPPYPASIGLVSGGGNISVQWVRVRSAPPNGVMPQVDIGTAVSCSQGVAGARIKCTVKIGGSPPPQGEVVWSTGSPGGFFPSNCKLTKGSCSVDYVPLIATAPVTITANLTGAESGALSSGTFDLYVKPKTTSTTMTCKKYNLLVGESTNCTADVFGYFPTGDVSISSSPDETGAVTGTGQCTLVAVGASKNLAHCSFTLIGITAGKAALFVFYNGNPNNKASAKPLTPITIGTKF